MLIRRPGQPWHPLQPALHDERALQTLLVQSPSLLPSPGPGELAVAANFRIGSTASVDLLGVGVDGRIVLVECGRQEGPGRRPMGGAALAVGAGLWRAPYEEFDRAFAVRAGVPLLDKAASIARAGGLGWDESAFRAGVTENLAAGRFQLILAVDVVSDEVRQVVAYLNAGARPGLAAVALGLRYHAEEGVELLIPQCPPATVAARGRRRRPQRGSAECRCPLRRTRRNRPGSRPQPAGPPGAGRRRGAASASGPARRRPPSATPTPPRRRLRPAAAWRRHRPPGRPPLLSARRFRKRRPPPPPLTRSPPTSPSLSSTRRRTAPAGRRSQPGCRRERRRPTPLPPGPGPARRDRPGRRQGEHALFAALEASCLPAAVDAVRRLYHIARDRGRELQWGNGDHPAVTAVYDLDGKSVGVWSCYTDLKPSFVVNFEWLAPHVPIERLQRLADRLAELPSVPERLAGLAEAGYKRRLALAVNAVLAQPGAADVINSALDRAARPRRRHRPAPRPARCPRRLRRRPPAAAATTELTRHGARPAFAREPLSAKGFPGFWGLKFGSPWVCYSLVT